MATLSLHQWEKQNEGITLFPAFTMEVTEPSVLAVYTHTHIREVLLQAFLGRSVLSDGATIVNGDPLKKRRSFTREVGVCRLEDGLYERIRVRDQVRLFQQLYASSWSVTELLSAVKMQERAHLAVKQLTYSEKQRLKLVRLCAQLAPLCVFEEPDQNVDLETRRIIARLFQRLQEEGCTVLVLTGNMESAVLLAENVYRLESSGLHLVPTQTENEEEEEPAVVEEKEPGLPFDKIPSRVNEKLILFHPTEIEFIESVQGEVHLHVQGETFPAVFTLTELEERLQPFGFFRCHRSYIVNLQNVREIMTWTRNSYTLVLNDASQAEIPLSKTKMAALKAMIGIK
ncbi:LytTR family transcriptional regulator DNA-binding domain-containing protein [Marinococcus sp. PL1-022]|uniref:LytTR family transcriptional regulator DNA-binding domain-containing protein n=1 Tax=Marinococcus sp. PL1-022 TaxID=3095363 RepID=UPI0029C3F23C|nr:LytTR family transcriptional regulator DNA-binding domain-containing protein [Marinococcus sp. PL1-022]MDX6152568.1 LytTR family transcriptional regulator DNA-binding domain-containing protein [Marinococcus sp. PL1-022]